MMRDYSDSYEFDREYCYPSLDVLISKLNIQDVDAFQAAERKLRPFGWLRKSAAYQRRK